MNLNLQEIDKVDTITKQDFIKNYFKPQKPLVIEQYIKDWPPYSKWNLDYIKKIAGNKIVPLYDDRPVDFKDGFNEPHARMKMSDYIDLLKKKPTKFRIFLWNILNEAPQLQQDFRYPDYEKWPALRHAKGYITELEHGNVLYMPEGYWHYMRYLTPGFSMSLRALARNPKNLGKALYNIFIMRNFDNLMREIRGQKWIDWKNQQAIVRTHKLNGFIG